MRTETKKTSEIKSKAKNCIDLYKKDSAFRAEFGLYAGLITSFAYAAFLAVCGFLHDSTWLGALAFYHLSLVAIRFVLTGGLRKSNRLGAWKAYSADVSALWYRRADYKIRQNSKLSLLYYLWSGGIYVL